MKCPYCNREMKAGFLHGGLAMLFWLPEAYFRQHAFVPGSRKKIIEGGGFVFHPGPGTDIFDTDGDVFYVCEDSGKMIAEIAKKS